MENKVQAVLSVQDQGYFSAMERAKRAADGMGDGIQTANKKTGSFMDTMLGAASAIGITAGISKGFNMISDSVGKALARADAMDNFKRTITLMTGSTDKANTALETMTGLVTGTAYGLDDAAKAAQGLVSSGIDVGKSTKLVGGWLDAISTYGDGTNESLRNVTFQLSQMASKGKANLGDLKSAMEAGIPVIQIYAEATGQSTEVVSDQISKGAISAEAFLDVMDKAFREGTKSFAKIEGAAKTAGGTWKGTFDNMKAATTRGMFQIVKAIEDGRADANLPGMKDAVADFGRFTYDVLNSVAGVAGFVARHFETLSTVLITGLSAWSGYRIIGEIGDKLKAFQTATQQAGSGLEMFFRTQKGGTSIQQAYYNALSTTEGKMKLHAAAQRLNIELSKKNSDGITKFTKLTDAQKAAILAETGAISLKGIVMGVLSGKIALTTAAQLAWNLAIKANPIGVIVAGAAALVGVLKLLNNKLTETTKEHRVANKEAEQMADTNKDLVRSTDDLGKSYQSNTTDARVNAAEAKRMVDGLVKLQNASMDAEEKQMRMGDAVAELNQAYPELNVQLDETGTAIEGSTDAIYDQIDAMHEQAKMEAMKDYLKDLYKQQVEYEVSIGQTNDQMAKMQEEGTNTQKTLFGLGSKTTEEFKKLEESSGSLTEGLGDVNSKIAQMEGQLEVSSEAQLRNRMEMDAQKKSLENLNEQYGVSTFAIVDYAEKSGKELDEVGAKVVGLSDQYGLSTDQIMKKLTESGLSIEDWAKLHEKIVEAGEKYGITADEIEKALEKTGLSLEDWAKRQDKLLEIADKYDLTTDQIESAVERQGLSLDEFAENHDKNLKQAGDAIETYVGTATDGWGKLKQESTITLKEYMKNMEENRKATEKWSTNVSKLMDAGVNEGIIKHLESMGPAGAAQAEQFVKELEGLNGGALGKWDELNNKTKEKLNELNMAQTAGIKAGGEAANIAIDAQNYPGMGSRMINEMETGMANELSGIKTQAHATGDAIHDKIIEGVSKADLKSNMIASGKFAMDGLDSGLNSRKQNIYDTAAEIARNISSKFRKSMEINSPSRLFRKYGQYIDEGLVLGMEDGFRDIDGATKKMADKVAGVDMSIPPGNIPDSAYSATAGGSPLELTLALGKRSYKAFINDIMRAQDSEIDLELKYN